MSKSTAETAVEGELLETVTLIQGHTHAGIDYGPGQTIEVNPLEKDWLIEHGIIANHTESPSHE